MAYTKRNWKDRIVQYARRYTMQSNGGSDKQLLPPMNEGWFLHESTRMRQANFEGKVSGSTVVNPHKVTTNNGGVSTANNALRAPYELSEITTGNYTALSAVGGAFYTCSPAITSGFIAQVPIHFDIIQEVINRWGVGVFGSAATLAARLAWCKANITKLIASANSSGSSPTGNKVTLAAYYSAWNTGNSHTSSAITKLSTVISEGNIGAYIQSDGFAHFLLYADPSNGTVASTVNVDFIELEIYMKEGSIPQADYELTMKGAAGTSYVRIPALPNTTYTMAAIGSVGTRFNIDQETLSGSTVTTAPNSMSMSGYTKQTFTTVAGTEQLIVTFYPDATGSYTISNPMLVLGAVDIPFAPMARWTINQSPGIVTDGGTPVNAANINWLEDGLAAAADVADLAWKTIKTQSLPDTTNMNTVLTNGRYYIYNAANAPIATSSFFYDVVVHSSNTVYVTQTAYHYVDNRIWTRRNVSGTWTVWVQLSNETLLMSSVNMDSLLATGNYFVNAPTSAPITGANMYVSVINSSLASTTHVTQIAYCVSDNRVWTRRLVSSVWTAWALISNDVITYPDSVSINTLVTNGMHYVYNGANAPIANIGLYYDVKTHPTTANLITQTAYQVDTNRVWTRRNAGGGWIAWTQLSNETITAAAASNLNALVKTGMYEINLGLNKPAGSSDWGYVDVINYNTNALFLKQTYYDFYSALVWTRVMNNGSWLPWSEVYTTASPPFLSGTYTGNGAATRDIALPFTPSTIIIMQRHGASTLGNGMTVGGMAITGNPVVTGSLTVVSIGANKVTVASSSSGANAGANETSAIYHYIAFK